jgi:hypothetical protein
MFILMIWGQLVDQGLRGTITNRGFTDLAKPQGSGRMLEYQH